MAKQPHYPGSLVPDTQHKDVQSKFTRGWKLCKSMLIFSFVMIESVCMEYVVYNVGHTECINPLLAFIIHRDIPVASHGDPDVLGAPFQEHGACQVVGCLLFTTPVVVYVIQSAPCQLLLLHLPQLPFHLHNHLPFAPRQLSNLSKTPLAQVCTTLFASNRHTSM